MRLSLLWMWALVFVFSIVSVRAGDTDHCPDISVGTLPGTSDIAKEGKVSTAWSTTVESRLIAIAAGEPHSKFYVQVDGADIERPHGPLTLLSSDTSVAVPSFTPESGSSGTVTSLGVVLSVFYHCRKPGVANLVASLPVTGFMTITWRWRKVCGNELPAHVHVGTAEGQSDVIEAGVVQPAWNGTVPQTEFPPERVRQALWLSSESDQAFFPFDIVVDPPIAVIVVNGHFNPESARTAPPTFEADQPVSFVAANQHAPLTFDTTCISAGSAVVTVRLATYALYDQYHPVHFGWKLRCGGVARPSFAVSTALQDDGVAISDANVAVEGVLTSAWNSTGYTADSLEQVAYLHYALIPAATGDAPSGEETQRMRTTLVSGDTSVVTVSTVDAKGQPLTAPPPPATTTGWHTLGIRFVCKGGALTAVPVSVSIRPGVFNPVDLVLVKHCGGFKSGFSVTLPGSLLVDSDLEKSDKIAVVTDGKATSAFNPHHPTAEVVEASSIPFSIRFGASRQSASGSGTRRRLLAAAGPARHSNETGPSRASVQGGGKALVKVDDGDWLGASLAGKGSHGGLYREGEEYKLELKTDCPSWGFFPSMLAAGFSGKTARVEVTVPIVAFEPGVFSVLARCDGWIQSVWGIVVFALIVIIVVALFVVCVMQGGGSLFAKLKGYAPVSQNDGQV